MVDRDVFRADVTLAAQGPTPVPISHHYAPGTRQNLRAKTALELGRPGRGELWFRLCARPESAFWDTTKLQNGAYRIRISAWDVAGNRSADAVDVVIENP